MFPARPAGRRRYGRLTGLPKGVRAVDDQPLTCAMCARRSSRADAVAWSREVTGRGVQWLCERCTRENLRSIEGRIDEAAW